MGRLLVLGLLVVVTSSATALFTDVAGVTRVGAKPIEDAVVWIDAPPGAGQAEAPPAVLSQRDIQFSPHVLAVQVGTKVKFPNQDRVFHNVFSYHDGKKFDLGVYPIGAVKYVKFDRPGVSRLFCNIHPGMAAYVVSVDSPYFAASDDEGSYVIHAPPGRYTYHAWRAGGTPLTGEVTVGDGNSFDIQWP